MSDPSTSANGLTLDITSDDPGIAYSREAYAEVCRLRAENAEKETMLLNQAKTIKEMQAEIDTLRRSRDRYRRQWEDLRRARAAYEGEK